jgi:glucose/arabinose dehydrogenase
MGAFIKSLAAGLFLATLGGTIMAQSQPGNTVKTERLSINIATLTEGLEHPWGIAVLPDHTLLVTEKPGRLRLVAADGKKGEPISGVPEVDARGQGGLLDVALHPQFEQNRLIYLSYAEPGENGANSTAVARAKLSQDGRTLADIKVIFSQKPKLPSTKHFGSRLIFDREGRLYVGLGERSEEQFRGQAQDLNSHLGKLVRLNDDGSVPPDNPFVNRQGALPEIWSYGHRNIQGAALHPDTGALWAIEHGPKGGDEINIPEAGKNYGWPIISYGVNYDGTPVGSGKAEMEGMEQPIYQWTPVIAPGGAIFYTGEMFPEWSGDLLVSGLKVRSLVRLDLDGSSVSHEERMLTDHGQRIRDVAQGPDGAIFVITDEDNGAIWKITRANPAASD